ncbi:MAG: hypothetical protein K8I30_15245, partial [Anaerolineae bacterium]|nr:hypothetical protein [Anaerolineae bacterium]
MVEKKSSRISRFFGFILFRIIPVLLIAGIAWFSYGVVKAVAQRVGEQVEAGQRSSIYEGTVAAILPTLTTHTPQPSATPLPSDTPTSTYTVTPSATLTPTPMPSNTPTATFTAIPSETPSPTSTETPVVVAQVFATNTPRALAVTLPALNTPVASIAPVVEASATPTST